MKEAKIQSTTTSTHSPHGPVSFKKTVRTEIIQKTNKSGSKGTLPKTIRLFLLDLMSRF